LSTFDDEMGPFLAKTPGLQTISYYVNQFAQRSLRDKVAGLIGAAHTGIMRKDYWSAVEQLLEAANSVGLSEDEDFISLDESYSGKPDDLKFLGMPLQRGFFVPLTFLFSEQQLPDTGSRILILFKGYCDTTRDIGDLEDNGGGAIPYTDIINEMVDAKDLATYGVHPSQTKGQHKSTIVGERYLSAWYRLVTSSWHVVGAYYRKVLTKI